MDEIKREVVLPPHLMLMLSVRGFTEAEIKESAANPTWAEQIQESAQGIRYMGTAWLSDERRVSIEYLDTPDNQRFVLDVITGTWNQ